MGSLAGGGKKEKTWERLPVNENDRRGGRAGKEELVIPSRRKRTGKRVTISLGGVWPWGTSILSKEGDRNDGHREQRSVSIYTLGVVSNGKEKEATTTTTMGKEKKDRKKPCEKSVGEN